MSADALQPDGKELPTSGGDFCLRLSKDQQFRGIVSKETAYRFRAEDDSAALKLQDYLDQRIRCAANESVVQAELERHPYLLVGRNRILNDVIVSKFPLGADFETDFAYMESFSHQFCIHLIEIESPKLRIFHRDGDFSQPFNKAAQQLADWQHWVKKNQTLLKEQLAEYLVGENPYPGYIEPACRLIAGWSTELSTEQKRARLQAKFAQLGPAVSFRTYNDFLEDLPRLCRACIGNPDNIGTVSYRKQGFRAK